MIKVSRRARTTLICPAFGPLFLAQSIRTKTRQKLLGCWHVAGSNVVNLEATRSTLNKSAESDADKTGGQVLLHVHSNNGVFLGPGMILPKVTSLLPDQLSKRWNKNIHVCGPCINANNDLYKLRPCQHVGHDGFSFCICVLWCFGACFEEWGSELWGCWPLTSALDAGAKK